MTVITKLALTFGILGLIIMLIACMIGMATVGLPLEIVAIYGLFTGLGFITTAAVLGVIAVLRDIWKD